MWKYLFLRPLKDALQNVWLYNAVSVWTQSLYAKTTGVFFSNLHKTYILG